MSQLTDFIFQFQQRILGRYTNKTAPLSIKKEDHANSFNEISDALLLINPEGLKNQLLFADSDNSNSYIPGNEVEVGQFITNDAELASALTRGASSQEKIFNSFKRIAHGGSPTDPQGASVTGKIPVRADQTNSWSYDTGTNKVLSTFNTGSFIGLCSIEKFTNYIHRVTLTSSEVDNDVIGVIIAYVEDPDNLVVNQAYGLNPSDFNWPIDVTSPMIPNQHVLSLVRCRNGVSTPLPSYAIIYDNLLPTRSVIANGTLSGVFNTTNNWSNATVDVNITVNGDSIQVTTTDFSDAPGGKGALRFPLTVDLNSNPLLEKFKGLKSYGYCAESQALASYQNIYFSGSSNLIYDLRDGSIYEFSSSGYTLNPARNFFNEIGVERILFNPYEFNLLYTRADKSIYLLATRSSLNPILDSNKITPFDSVTQVSIDWQSSLAPNSALTYAQLFGNNPIITTFIDNGDGSFSKLSEDSEVRVKSGDTLTTLTINLGAFPQSGEIIIS